MKLALLGSTAWRTPPRAYGPSEPVRGFSHLTCARSGDGVSDRIVDDHLFMTYDGQHADEEWGLKAARVTWGRRAGRWIIAQTAFGRGGPGVSVAQSADVQTFERLGTNMPPENKNAALLPRRIGGDGVLFHRPVSTAGADVWLSLSTDLETWREPEPVVSRREGGGWDSARIGMGPPPLETEHGWLVIYHGVRQTVVGACTARASRCRSVDSDKLFLYYGAADTRIGLATASRADVLDYLFACPSG